MTATVERLSGWEYEARKIREKEAAREAANPGPVLRPHEVVVQGHEIPLDSSVKKNSTVGKIAWLAYEHGWDVKVGEAVYRKPDRVQKGEVIEGKEVAWRWVQGVSKNRRHHFSASTELILYDGWPIESVGELEVGLIEHGEEGQAAE